MTCKRPNLSLYLKLINKRALHISFCVGGECGIETYRGRMRLWERRGRRRQREEQGRRVFWGFRARWFFLLISEEVLTASPIQRPSFLCFSVFCLRFPLCRPRTRSIQHPHLDSLLKTSNSSLTFTLIFVSGLDPLGHLNWVFFFSPND